jgi:uncharacterized protein
MTSPPTDDQVAAVTAIHAGDLATLTRLLTDNPGLATARIDRHGGRTLTLIATDWPGHFPNSADTIRVLVAAGADVNTASLGEHPETPLHWAASSDDIAALDALIDAGADIDAAHDPNGSSTPLFDATASGQWRTARRLLERGAHAGFWEAAVMGMLPQLKTYFADGAQPTTEQINDGFWGACHGGQHDTAAYLLEHGADINRPAFDDLTPIQAAQRSDADDLVHWLKANGAVIRADPAESSGR